MATKLKVVSEYSDKGLKRAKSDIGAFGRYTSGVFKQVGGVIAGVFAVRSIINFVKTSIGAYLRQEKAVESLRQAILSSIQATDSLGDAATRQAQKLEKLTQDRSVNVSVAVDDADLDIPEKVSVEIIPGVEQPTLEPVSLDVIIEQPTLEPVGLDVDVKQPTLEPIDLEADVKQPILEPVDLSVDVEQPTLEPVKLDVDVEQPTLEPVKLDVDVEQPTLEPVKLDVDVEQPTLEPVKLDVDVEQPTLEPVKLDVDVEQPTLKPVKLNVDVEQPTLEPVKLDVDAEPPTFDPVKLDVSVDQPEINVDDTAFKNANQQAEIYTSNLQKAASALQVLTRVGDEAIMEIMAQGAQMGVAADNLDEYATAVLMVSRTTGQGLREVAKQVKDQFAGQTNELSRLIPALNNATTAQERYDSIMAFANARMKEQTELSLTNAERALAVQAAWSDLTEQIGAFFIESGLAQNVMDELLFAIEDIQAVGFGAWFEETFPKIDAFISRIVKILDKLGMLEEKIEKPPQTRRGMEAYLTGTRMGAGLTEMDVARGVGRPPEQRTAAQQEETMTELERRRSTRDAERQARREEREARKAQRLEEARATIEAMRSAFTPSAVQQQAATTRATTTGGQALSAGDLFERAFGATVAAANGTRQNPYFVVLNNPEDINTGLAE